MPFVTQTDTHTYQPPADVRNIFTGRVNEQRFFVQHILTSEVPTTHVIWVWGPAGVGKSTLLTCLRDKARHPGLKGSCLTALVDQRLSTPADLMERCAVQLRLAGAPLAAFEQELSRYKQATHHPPPEQVVARVAFVRKVSALTETKVMDEAVLGGLYETVAREANASFGSRRQTSQPMGEAGPLNGPLADLTRAFVDDLNWLTTTHMPFRRGRTTRGRRVVLFFDTFEPSAAETIGWLLHYVLPATISNQVVLVVAGREPISQSLPGEQQVSSMPLAPFTERETRTYLARCGITAKDRVAAIWHLSGGLPLSVSMLAYDPEGPLDVTTDVATNVLRRLERRDRRMQQLILQAALCSRPFTQDDLAAFQTLTGQEQVQFYRRLIELPCVQASSLDGRHRFHPLARHWFARAFSQRAPQEEQAARRALARYYQQRLEHLQRTAGRSAFLSIEWLALARVSQLFCLTDTASHASAIEQVMEIVSGAKQEERLVAALRALLQEQPDTQVSASARHITQLLLRYLEADLASQEVLTAATDLLEAVRFAPAFSPALLARIYGKRGMAYYWRSDYQQAIADFDRALALDPRDALAYAGRGHVHLEMGEIERARADFLDSQALAPHDVYLGLLLAWLDLCQQESLPERTDLAERLEALAARDQQPLALVCRGLSLLLRGRFEEAEASLDQALLLNPGMREALFWKSLVCALLRRDEEARVALERALAAELPLATVLLTPLRWLEQKRPDFYRRYAEPVLAHSEGISEQYA